MTAIEALYESERRLRGRLNMNLRNGRAAVDRGDTFAAATSLARAEGYRTAIGDIGQMITEIAENTQR